VRFGREITHGPKEDPERYDDEFVRELGHPPNIGALAAALQQTCIIEQSPKRALSHSSVVA
jgi:hypothetical protein